MSVDPLPKYVSVDIEGLTDALEERRQYRERYEDLMEAAKRGDRIWQDRWDELVAEFESVRRELHEMIGRDYAVEPLPNAELLAAVRDTRVIKSDVIEFHMNSETGQREPVADGQVVATIAAAWEPDDGPPTETLQPVARPGWACPSCGDPHGVTAKCTSEIAAEQAAELQPPIPPEGFKLGRKFWRGLRVDAVTPAVDALIQRDGTVWSHDPSHPSTTGVRFYHNRATATWWTGVDLLHMHGTLWELVEHEQQPVGTDVLRDLLLLVGVTVTAEQAGQWSLEQREQAADWAAAVHLSASDNDDVVVPSRPEFLDEVTAGE